jgi:hypothetical protein
VVRRADCHHDAGKRGPIIRHTAGPLPAGYNTAIKSVPDFGGSGFGVIDANKRCLVGMITRTIAGTKTSEEDGRETVEPVTVAKYFIPASQTADFFPADLHY